MKSSIFKSIVVASMIVLATGCGKKGGGGGGTPVTGYPSYYQGTATQNTQQAMTSLMNWYNGAVEGTRVQGFVKVQKVLLPNSSDQNCSEIDLKIFKIPYCTYSSSITSSNTGTVISEQIMTINQNGQIINQKGNQELSSIFDTASGSVVQASENGSVIRVDKFINDKLVSYIIDRNYHSALNPVQIIEVTTSSAASVFNKRASCAYSGYGCTIQ